VTFFDSCWRSTVVDVIVAAAVAAVAAVVVVMARFCRKSVMARFCRKSVMVDFPYNIVPANVR
jgi:hypothetical protein